MLKRESILGLFGIDRYHSCICTTFAFDFLYFEIKVMRALLTAGVQNVTVFVDGKYYNELMEHPSLQEGAINNTYALYPIYTKGVFHPKIMMLFGRKEALLLIGSGNLTSSGIAGNDEIWGAFHFSEQNPGHAGLFRLAWTYLQQFTTQAEGVSQLRTGEWLWKNASWLNDLPAVSYGSMLPMEAGNSLTLLWHIKDFPLYEQVQIELARKQVRTITLLAPYYDKDGATLERYRKDYHPEQVNVVVEETGILPIDHLPHEGLCFFSWKQVNPPAENEDPRKLHGKIHHFACADGSEYMLFGSANVTEEALGLTGLQNEEVCLWIYSEKGGLLTDAGINLEHLPPIRLETVRKQASRGGNEGQNLPSFKHRITVAEREEGEVTIYLLHPANGEVRVRLYSFTDTVLFDKTLLLEGKRLQFRIDFIQPIHSVQLLDEQGNPISGRSIVHDTLLLLRTNPDPRSRDVDKAINDCKDEEDGDRYIELLHYAFDDVHQEELQQRTQRMSSGMTAVPANGISGGHTPKAIETFSILDPASYHRSQMLSASVKIVDLLKHAFSDNPKQKHQDLRVDEQVTDADEAEGDPGQQPEDKRPSKQERDNQQVKLIRFFDRLGEHFRERGLNRKDHPEYKVGIPDMARYVIAVKLIQRHWEKPVDSKEGNKMYFLSDDGAENWSDNLKSLLLGLCGWFLQACTRGIQTFDYEYTHRKFEDLKQEAFQKTLLLLCQAHWKSTEQKHFFSLAMNTLLYLGGKKDCEESVVRAATQHLELALQDPKNNQLRFLGNAGRIQNSILPEYRKLLSVLSLKSDQRSRGKLPRAGEGVYMSRYGVGHVTIVQTKEGETSVGFTKPGLLWNIHEERFDAEILPWKLMIPVSS